MSKKAYMPQVFQLTTLDQLLASWGSNTGEAMIKEMFRIGNLIVRIPALFSQNELEDHLSYACSV